MTNRNVWKPTQEECDLIRKAASLESSPSATLSQITLDAGYRQSLDSDSEDSPVSFNIARVTKRDDDTWADTGLCDFASWAHFRKGVELTEDGRAIVDFYIRPRTSALEPKLGGLLGNIVVYYARGRLVAIRGVDSHGRDYLSHLRPNSKLERHREYVASARARGAKTIPFSCPCCRQPLDALAAPRGMVWDSYVECPYCRGKFYNMVSSTEVAVQDWDSAFKRFKVTVEFESGGEGVYIEVAPNIERAEVRARGYCDARRGPVKRIVSIKNVSCPTK